MKSALWLSIGKIVDEETIKLGINATPQFIGALTEMVWAQIGRALSPTSGERSTRGFSKLVRGVIAEFFHYFFLETASQDLESFAK